MYFRNHHAIPRDHLGVVLQSTFSRTILEDWNININADRPSSDVVRMGRIVRLPVLVPNNLFRKVVSQDGYMRSAN